MTEPATVRVEQPVYGAQQLVVRAPYELRYKLADIPGARWSGPKKAWTYPVSAVTAAALAEILGVEAFAGSTHAQSMLEEGLRQANSSASKVAAAADAGSLEPLPFPTTIPPWAHQLGMIRFAEPLRAVLWNVGMGAGKTAAAIHLIRLRKHAKTLVIAPLSVVPAWEKQVSIHAPNAMAVVVVNEGSTPVRALRALNAWKKATPEKPVIVVTNYECGWSKHFQSAISQVENGLDLIIADECHRLKAPGGKQSVAYSKISAEIPYKLGLSGTPLPNSPMDGYGIFRFLDPGIFGRSFVAFRTRYAKMGGFQGKQVIGYQNKDDFARRIAPFTYEVDRSVLDLPPSTHLERVFELNPEAKAIYNAVKDEFIASVDAGKVTVTNALTKLLRLSQIASGSVGLDLSMDDYDEEGHARNREVREIHTQKQEILREILEEIDPKEPVVVFARFKNDLEQIRKAAKGLGGVAELSGSKNELADWQTKGGPRVLAAQIQSGAEGIDLTRACYCVYFSKDYSRGRYLQSLARSDRPGQTRPVTYIHIIAEKTTDRLIMKALEKKGAIIDEVLEEIRRWS